MKQGTVKACKHGKYQWKGDVAHVHNEKLGINQPVLQLKLYCVLCKAPCYFRGEESFSLERPSVGDEHVLARLPFCYPEEITEVMLVEKAREDTDEDVPHTIH